MIYSIIKHSVVFVTLEAHTFILLNCLPYSSFCLGVPPNSVDFKKMLRSILLRCDQNIFFIISESFKKRSFNGLCFVNFVVLQAIFRAITNQQPAFLRVSALLLEFRHYAFL